jgi:hypothetical protein
MPYWLMNAEELLDLMIDRAEASAPNQNAKFKELLQAEKENSRRTKAWALRKLLLTHQFIFPSKRLLLSLDGLMRSWFRVQVEKRRMAH